MKKYSIKHLLWALLLIAAIPASPQALNLLSPNGGDTLYSAQNYNIQWSYINVENIQIEYSVDAGLNWITITPAIPTSTLSYNWLVPSTPSTACLVRITDILGGAQDESDAYFTIPVSTLTLLYPQQALVYESGTIQSVEWEMTGIANVNIEYSADAGSTWQSVANGVAAGWGYYNWTLPLSATTTGFLRIFDALNTAIGDTNENAFQIISLPLGTPAKFHGGAYDGYAQSSSVNDSLVLISPNGGEVWNSNTPYFIEWSYNNVDNIKIEVSYNNGSTWTTLSENTPASANKFQWTVTGFSDSCKVRITDIMYGLTDISASTFSIPVPELKLMYPDSGINVVAQSIEFIQWSGSDIANVSLEYSVNNGQSWNLITASVPGIWGYYNWTIPDSVTQTAKIRVIDVSNPATRDSSKLTFGIINRTSGTAAKFHGGAYDGYAMMSNVAPSITVLSPNGSEIWVSSTTQTITWESTNVDNLRIEFSKDNGNIWEVINPNIPASANQYSWLVPSQPSFYCLIRLADINSSLSDVSDSVFTIPDQTVQLIYPTGNINFMAGTIQSVEWSSPASQTVKIEFSSDNGTTWQMIADNVNGHWGYLNWTIPAITTNEAKIKVTDTGNPLYTAVNAVNFSITSQVLGTPAKFHGGSYDGYAMSTFKSVSLLVKSPNGWEAFLQNDVKPIKWSHLNMDDNIKIEYSNDNEQNWNVISASQTVEPTLYNWSDIVPVSSLYKIRITDSTGLYTDKSDNFFIVGQAGILNTGIISGSPLCASAQVSIPFTTTESYNAGNIFLAQLSDSAGVFSSNADSIGVLYSTASGTIDATLPINAEASFKYRIRVVSTDPPIIGTDNGADIQINPLPKVNLGNDTLLCIGDTLTLQGGTGAISYLWSTGATTSNIAVAAPGEYFVASSNSCGTLRDTLQIYYKNFPVISLPQDTFFCVNEILHLDATDSNTSSYLWSNGVSSPYINIINPGTYYVSATNTCGEGVDTVTVIQKSKPLVNLGNDTTFCGVVPIVLDAGAGFPAYNWSTGDITSSITAASTGFYRVSVTDNFGCTNEDMIYLKMNDLPAVDLGSDTAVCQSYVLNAGNGFASYSWSNGANTNQIVVSASDVYFVEVMDLLGCKNSDTIMVALNNSSTSDTSVLTCDSYTWFGITYTASGTPTHVLSNAAGCDSTITLNLTINNSTGSTLNETACDTYTLNAQTYTSSGIYTQIMTNVTGCDSTITLNLTISNSTTSTMNETACDTYTLNAQTYNTSGTYTQTLTNTAGCDSTITLNLTISNSATSTLNETACDTYTLNAQTYTASGTYTQIMTNVTGCDSTITLNLTINNSTSSIQTIAACNNYIWNGNNYTVSGTYMDTISNATGCDSVLTLVLTINPLPSATLLLNPDVVCNDTSAFPLSGGSPAGGTYSGPAVTAGNFAPAIAGAGVHSITYTFTDSSGCSDYATASLVVDVCTGISSVTDKSNSLIIVPNPGNGKFKIINSKLPQAKILIYNVLGEIIYESENQKSEIDLSAQQKGIYSVVLKTGGKLFKANLVLQ